MIQFYGNDSNLSFWRASCAFAPYPELSLFAVTTVRELHLNDCFPTDPSSLLSQLPALETLVLVNATGSYSFAFLAAEPVLCPSLKNIAFLDCKLDQQVIGSIEEAVVKRKKSTAAWLYRIIIIVKEAGDFLNRDLVLRLRRSVPRVDIRIDDKLPDLS